MAQTTTPTAGIDTAALDQKVVDTIAAILAAPSWNHDMFDHIHAEIAKVRPAPGDRKHEAEYAEAFTAATGRDLPGDGEWWERPTRSCIECDYTDTYPFDAAVTVCPDDGGRLYSSEG